MAGRNKKAMNKIAGNHRIKDHILETNESDTFKTPASLMRTQQKKKKTFFCLHSEKLKNFFNLAIRQKALDSCWCFHPEAIILQFQLEDF